MKKKMVNSSAKSSMLKEALIDLEKEISGINKEKKDLTNQIKNADKNLENFREFERKLQERIAMLIDREASLKEKKKATSMKEEKLVDKLSKIEKIKSELGEI